MNNIHTNIPASIPDELFQDILNTPHFKLERIVSNAHATPPGEWYDQDWHEWVILLSGSAGLRIEGDADVQALEPGDYVYLPAHQRHRVEWTDDTVKTIWLALHFAPE